MAVSPRECNPREESFVLVVKQIGLVVIKDNRAVLIDRVGDILVDTVVASKTKVCWDVVVGDHGLKVQYP